MKGILYGVGVGPGDEKMLTLRAVETLECADVIVVPDSGGEKTALRIAQRYIGGKEIIYCPMPMTRDESVLEENHRRAADVICAQLDKGLNLAFITLGDPTVYSTYMYVHRLVRERGYTARIVSGVPSFCAAAARLELSLCDRGQALHIVPSSYDHLEELLSLEGTKVLMKSGKNFPAVRESLRKHGLIGQSKMAERCSMEDEQLYENLDDVKDSNSYFSIIIVKGQ
jgi:precorrin-2/cobalt-factor-2 C20-methyltransferase